MRALTSLFVALTVLAAGAPALARASEQIVEYRDMAVRTGSGKPASAQQVCAALTAAVDAARAEKNYPWARVEMTPGSFVASLLVRHKHTIRVDVACAADKYSVTYKDSSNMNYKQKKSGAVIHPYYNVWVAELVAGIDAELGKL